MPRNIEAGPREESGQEEMGAVDPIIEINPRGRRVEKNNVDEAGQMEEARRALDKSYGSNKKRNFIKRAGDELAETVVEGAGLVRETTGASKKVVGAVGDTVEGLGHLTKNTGKFLGSVVETGFHLARITASMAKKAADWFSR